MAKYPAPAGLQDAVTVTKAKPLRAWHSAHPHWNGEVVPDSEEERQLTKAVIEAEILEISSDEDDILDDDMQDDPFVVKIPGAGRANERLESGRSSELVTALPEDIPTRLFLDTSVKSTPRRKYYARRIIESSEDEDSHGLQGADREIIELSDSSPERPSTVNTRVTNPSNIQRTPFVQMPTYSDEEDTCDEHDAILILNEPRSARKPIRVHPASDRGSIEPLVTTTPRKRPQHSLRNSSVPSTPNASRVKDPATPLTRAGVKTPRASKKAHDAAEQAKREIYARELFDELNRAVFDDGLPKETKLTWSKRLLSTAGKAKWHRSREGAQTTEIELAEKILDCEERIRNTLSHEMCHLASWIINDNPAEVHGAIWKKWACRVMRKHPEIDITTRHNYEISYPFQWKCELCAKIYGRFSKSIKPEECVCGACKEGKLLPLFPQRKARNTPRTSQMAWIKARDSPHSVPRTQNGNGLSSGGTGSSGSTVLTIRDSDSESDPDVAILTTTMGSVTIVASEEP